MNKKIIFLSVFIASIALSSSSYACIMMGMSGQGGDCANICLNSGKPAWLCMLGSPASKAPKGDAPVPASIIQPAKGGAK